MMTSYFIGFDQLINIDVWVFIGQHRAISVGKTFKNMGDFVPIAILSLASDIVELLAVKFEELIDGMTSVLENVVFSPFSVHILGNYVLR
jgi:hypothetical protein